MINRLYIYAVRSHDILSELSIFNFYYILISNIILLSCRSGSSDYVFLIIISLTLSALYCFCIFSYIQKWLYYIYYITSYSDNIGLLLLNLYIFVIYKLFLLFLFLQNLFKLFNLWSLLVTTFLSLKNNFLAIIIIISF